MGMHCAAEPLVIAHPGEEFGPEETVVWSPLFQAAWDELNKEFGKPVRVEPANALMADLDAFRWDVKTTMPVSGWKVWSGDATRGLIDRANAEAAAMTGEQEGPFRLEGAAPDSRLALGLLNRNLFFQKALHRAKSASLEFKEAGNGDAAKVAFFGVRGAASAGFSGSVRVGYRSNDSFTVSIAGRDDEAVVCDLPESVETMESAVRRLRDWRNAAAKGNWGALDDPRMHENDDLRIPFLDCDVAADFTSRLEGARYFEGQVLPRRIFIAEQHLEFELTEKGARLRAAVTLGDEPFGEAPQPPRMMPRKLHFDRPFFVFLWRDGADWPYFGAWIGNADAMESVD